MPATQPAIVPATQPAIVPATQPTIVPAIQPAIVPATQPAIVPATQPAIVPATQPAIVPATQPAIVPATQPAIVPATQPAIVPATQPAATEPAVVPACRMLTSINDIQTEFAKMTTEVMEALIKAKVNVSVLIKRLRTITIVRDKKVPLFDDDVLTKIKSIDDLWEKLSNFWIIFDYEVLEFVINLSECNEAQKIFKDFKSRIEPSAIADADLMLYCTEEHWKGKLKPVLRIKVNAEVKDRCTPKVENEIKKVVSEAYVLEKYNLCFRGIKEGCIEMVYYISKPLKFHLLNFAITGSNMAEFLAHAIISLHIDDSDDEYELKVPSKIADMVSCIA